MKGFTPPQYSQGIYIIGCSQKGGVLLTIEAKSQDEHSFYTDTKAHVTLLKMSISSVLQCRKLQLD